MTSRRLFLVLAAAMLCGTSVSCAGIDHSITVQGAGATFPAPLYKRWFLEYYQRHPDVRVNYQAIGSGAGIRQFTEGLTAFGASDAAMSKAEAERFKHQRGVEPLLLPMTAGSIVLAYNLPGGPRDLKLSRKAYVGIFLGQITSWKDPAIAAANPGVPLEDVPITIVRRSDGSGTTYAFTNHLSAISEEWKHGPGVGKSVVWPVGIGGRGNSGVAALIEQTPGAIGYLEFGYAELAHLPMAVLANHAGNFIKASPESCQAALAGATLPADFRIWVADPAGKDAYPIVTYTWILCYTDYTKYKYPAVAEPVKQVLRFCLTEGQRFSKELGYIPLPQNIADQVLAAVDRIRP